MVQGTGGGAPEGREQAALALAGLSGEDVSCRVEARGTGLTSDWARRGRKMCRHAMGGEPNRPERLRGCRLVRMRRGRGGRRGGALARL